MLLIIPTVRILVTADLHYEIARSRGPTERLAKRACKLGGEAIVLVGDTAGADPTPLRECLRLFGAFPGRKLLVAGNHCLWCRPGENSLDRYRRLLPALAEEEGFILLDHQPVVIDNVGLVGSVGWYDYSFRDRSLGIPKAFYRAKVAPGAAARMGAHYELFARYRAQLDQSHLAIGTIWMDGVHVNLPMSDEEFVDVLAEKLAGQIKQVTGRCRRIIAFVHHLPFRELVPQDRPPRFAFAAGFMGSQRLGEVLLADEKVTHVYCGHSHWPAKAEIGRLTAISIGSTYTEKQLEVLEV